MNKKTLVWIFVLFSLVSLGFATDYDYWIEHDESNNPANYVWVKIDSIPASSTKTIYAIKESGFNPNGDAVFQFFDDFQGTSLNTSKWNEFIANGYYSVSDSNLYLTGVSKWEAIGSNTMFSHPIIVDGYLKTNGNVEAWWFGFDDRTSTGSYQGSGLDQAVTGTETNTNKYYRTFKDGSKTDISRTSDYTSYIKSTIKRTSNEIIFYENGILSGTISTNVPLDNMGIVFMTYHGDYTSEMWVDWVFLRKYTATEPTVSVTDMGTYYKIDITNNEASELTDYQVAIPINDLDVTSTDESLHFTDSVISISITLNQTSGYVGDSITVNCSATSLESSDEYRIKEIVEGIDTNYTDSFSGVESYSDTFSFTIQQSQAHTNITVTCELEKNESGTWTTISSDSKNVEVLNTPPTEPDISLNYIDIVGGNIVQATCENSTDTVDNDSITYRLIVTNSTDTLHNSTTNFTYTTSKSQVNQTLNFICVADDGYDTSQTSQSEFVYGVSFDFGDDLSLGSYITSYQTNAEVIPNQIKVYYTLDGNTYTYCESDCGSSGFVNITDLGNHTIEWNVVTETENYTDSDNFKVLSALINLTIKDERTLDNIDSANVSFVTSEYGYSFNYSPGNKELHFVTSGEGFILIKKDGYFSETVPIITQNQEGEIITYLLKTTDGTTMEVTLKDELSKPLAGKFVDLYKYYSSENAYIRVTTKITDSEGKAIIPVETESFYKYYARLTIGDTPKLAYPYPFQPTSSTMTLYYGSFTAPTLIFNLLSNLEYTLSTSRTASNETVISFFFNDKTGLVTQGCIEAYDRRITTDVYLGTSCTNASSGTLFLTIPDGNWSRILYYKARVYVDATNEDYLIDTGYVRKPTTNFFGSTSLFVVFLISVSVVAIGSIMSPVVGFVLLGVVMFITSFFGLTIMATTTIISFMVIVLLILFKR